MISYLRGQIIDKSDSSVTVLVGGVGYEVFVTPRFMGTLLVDEDETELYTYTQVAENLVALYGFKSKAELIIFKHLITVSGIGPKGALAILSVFTVKELIKAVINDDSRAVAKAPGIGAKTAGKLIIELKDKFRILAAADKELLEEEMQPGAETAADDEDDSILEEAILALTSLGYSKTEATKSVKSVERTADMTVEELIKKSLSARKFL